MSNVAKQHPSPHLRMRPEWLAQAQEEAIVEPDLPIVDPHHHLWHQPHNRYLFEDLLADLRTGHNVTATMFMECRSMYRHDGDPELRSLGETQFAAGAAAMSESGLYGGTRICEGLVGYVDLRLGARVEELLQVHRALAGGRFRGVRNIAAWDADPSARGSSSVPPSDLLAQSGFREGFARLARIGLSFDTWVYHTQLAQLRDLARAFPEATIVLDHVGTPIGIGPYAGRRDEVLAAWRRGIKELATCPNVFLKVGGFGMRVFGFALHETETPPTSQALAEAWRPLIEICVDAFGPERCMFESNFPVDKGTCGYAALWNALKLASTGYSMHDRAALFSGTAKRVYRLAA